MRCSTLLLLLLVIIGACSNAVLAVDCYRPGVLGKIRGQSGNMRQHLLKVTNLNWRIVQSHFSDTCPSSN